MKRCPATTAFFISALIIALAGYAMLGVMLDADGWTAAEVMLFAVFAILFGYLAFGFTHAATGVVVRFLSRFQKTRDEPADTVCSEGRVAIVMPVFNEDVDKVFQRLKATFRSVLRENDADLFDLHILSDSNRSEQWLLEERAWLEWVGTEKLEGRVFYRHRNDNHGKKAGNVADFCRARGNDYEFMLVLDADSVMTGATVTELRRRIAGAESVALLQTVPRLVGGRTFFGRAQQFANRFYGPVFMAGLDFWQRENGNFWGHNAIIRLRPFMDECGLPELPGPVPIGGPHPVT